MIVVSVTNCPPKLRGDLSKWLLEINTGVYVGNINAKVREALWKRICENISNGQATMVFNAQNEQHMDFYVHNTHLKPIDFDGIKLMLHPDQTNSLSNTPELKQGFSNNAKRRMGKRRKINSRINSYVVLDIETSGLSVEKNEIIEIGIIEISDNNIVLEKEWLIKPKNSISSDITGLTGIDNNMLIQNGIPLSEALTELFEIISFKDIFIYNASFDLSFLEKSAEKCSLEFPDISVKDVLVMTKNRIKEIENYKLETVARYFGISDNQRHRALEDCHLLMKVIDKLNEI